MGSVQTLSLDQRRRLALWAADCAERALTLADPGTHAQLDEALGRARAFGTGRMSAAEAIRLRGTRAARDATTAAGTAAARSVSQAAAVAHMGAHALGAAAYAVEALVLASSDPEEARRQEIAWQLGRATAEVRSALAGLPPVGVDAAGPLGPGLLSRGLRRRVIRELQSRL